MFTTIEAREFLRYTDIKAGELTKTVISTGLGSRLLLGGMAAFLGLSADHQANWQVAISPKAADHILTLDSHPHFSAPKYDPSLIVEMPNVQVPTGEYETIRGIGSDGKEVTITRIYGEKDPDNKIPGLIIRDENVSISMAKNLVQYLFIPDPLPNYLNNFTYWTVQKPKDESRGNESIERIIDRVSSATSVIPLETYFLIKGTVNDPFDGGITGVFWGWNKPQSIKVYGNIMMPEELSTNDTRKLAPAHERLHIYALTDEYMKPGNIVTDDPNCNRNPLEWGWKPTSYKGCNYDKESYRPTETSIMRELVPFLGEFNSQWLKETMNVFRWQQPGLKVKVTSPPESFDKKIETKIPYGTKRVWYQLLPPNNDGPGINLIISDPQEIERMRKEGLSILAPKLGEGNYVLLPGMKRYKFIVRISDSVEDIPEDSPKWMIYYPWPLRPAPLEPAVDYFSTPDPSFEGITAVSPKVGEVVNTSTPTLVWDNTDKDVFYYENQVSKDCSFNTDPQTATAPVWHNLIHGGMTSPLNSWQTPELELGTEYCWRARPRIQGDGTPVSWSETFRFSTPATLKGVRPDLADYDYGNGIIGPSKEDYDRANIQP